MPVYKGTLLFQFQNQPPCGFSESFEFSSTSDNTAKLAVSGWPTWRKKWLSSDWKIVGFRLSKETTSLVGTKCKKKFVPVQIGACVGSPAGELGNADSPYTAVYFKITSAGSPHVRVYLARGIPDTWWSAGALNIPPADGNAFLLWFNQMKGGVFQVGVNTPQLSGCSQDFHLWQSYCSVRIASRRIGRPFGLLHGRRATTS